MESYEHNHIMVIERDVGLFSLILQVVNTLELIEKKKINRVPIVIFGKRCTYFNHQGWKSKRTVWEYYFEPLNENNSEDLILNKLGPDAINILESVNKEVEHERGKKEFPDTLHLLDPLTAQDHKNLVFVNSLFPDFTWTDNYRPEIDGEKHEGNEISQAKVIEKFIRFRPYISEKIETFFNKNLKGNFVIGVHVRGTDGHGGLARTGKEIDIEGYFKKIKEEMKKQEKIKIFIASDEERYVDIFKSEFGDLVVSCDVFRKKDDGNAKGKIFGEGPTGQVMPAYITESTDIATQNGEDAVIEFGLLCKSDLFLHNKSSLSDTVNLACPEIEKHNFPAKHSLIGSCILQFKSMFNKGAAN